MKFNQQLLAALHDEPSGILFEYKGRDYSRGEVVALGNRLIALLDAAGAPTDAKIGIIVRNRALHAAVMLFLIAKARPLTTIYSMQSPEAIAEEISASGFCAVISDTEDWSEAAINATRDCGAVALRLDHAQTAPDKAISPINGLEAAGSGPFTKLEGEPGIEILSSGTTGKPKRIRFPFRILTRTVESATAGRPKTDAPEPDILTWPYGGIGGMLNLVASVMLGRLSIILEKFNIPEWTEALKKHRPSMISGPPAVAAMALDAKVPAETLSSVKYFYGGGAPFSPELQEAFEATYDLKVIWAYGATEFCGTIISWSPDLHETFGDSKKGSMGQALPGISVRITDVDTGEVLKADQVGYLEAMVPAVRDGWIKTTDLARIDADGFIFHHGRGDGAIIRGGFKVLPEKIVDAMKKHPAVLDAGVVALPDQRLGEVPAVAVELKQGAGKPSPEELKGHAKRELVAHHVPVRFMIMDSLPRTTSMKVGLGEIKNIMLANSP